jgi:predicted acetyltransferase
MAPPFTVGPAHESELERLVAIHLTAFPDARGAEPRRRKFQANPRGGFDRLQVVRRASDGEVVGHAFLFDLAASFGGTLVRTGGIATVGVATEARGAGVARTLIEHLHARSLAEGHAITMLYAFRQGFYARHGYVQAPSQRRLSIAPAAFAHFKGRAAGHHLRVANGDDLPRLRELHAQEAARHSGWALRTELSWLPLLADERTSVIVAVRDGVTRGAIFTALLQDEAHARTLLRVDDLLAEDAETRAALYAHLHAQRDQVAEIRLEVPDGDSLELALVDADAHGFGVEELEHPLGIVAGGPMMRIVEPARALAARGYTAALEDTFLLDVDGRKLSVHAGAGVPTQVEETTEPADLRLDARALTALAFGGWKASSLVDLGWAEALTTDAVARAERLFALAPFFSRDPF